VRIVVPISSTGEDAAQSRGLEFIHQILPILDRYIPR
jgi:hypothetical protein